MTRVLSAAACNGEQTVVKHFHPERRVCWQSSKQTNLSPLVREGSNMRRNTGAVTPNLNTGKEERRERKEREEKRSEEKAKGEGERGPLLPTFLSNLPSPHRPAAAAAATEDAQKHTSTSLPLSLSLFFFHLLIWPSAHRHGVWCDDRAPHRYRQKSTEKNCGFKSELTGEKIQIR